MSLYKRIIPCLDVDDGRVVKGTNFVNITDAGDPVEVAKRYDREGADEITFLDITATHQKRKTIVDIVEKVASEVFIPLTVGGGVSNYEDVLTLLKAGADKVAINSAAVDNPEVINKVTDKIGRQCIVAAIDAKKKSSSTWEVFILVEENLPGLMFCNGLMICMIEAQERYYLLVWIKMVLRVDLIWSY